ncbi:hypothetical protein PT276_05235 [Orbaceae bacterium ESL0721]|nr:hypothetical protein [Orbaceae bacterium ESL0721]
MRNVMLFLILIFILRLFVLPSFQTGLNKVAKLITYFGLILIVMGWLLNKYQLVLYYPVIVNLIMLILFAYSLYRPPTIITLLAQIKKPQLSLLAIQYTRRVTIAWCLFFIINGSIAFLTCIINQPDLWTLYNGLISYLLIALLMGGEWLIRQKIEK